MIGAKSVCFNWKQTDSILHLAAHCVHDSTHAFKTKNSLNTLNAASGVCLLRIHSIVLPISRLVGRRVISGSPLTCLQAAASIAAHKFVRIIPHLAHK